MNHDLSKLSLTELCDQLSECTALYSKSMLNGFPDKEFSELKSLIVTLQKEIEKRKSGKGNSDDSPFLFPPHNSASA